MAAHTFDWARKLQRKRGIELHVQFSGGTKELFESKFFEEFEDDSTFICPQADGDLGQKLMAIVCQLKQTDVERVVIVGTDCPELDATFVNTAFERLHEHNVCFSPAEDGGYTLIGLHLHQTSALPVVFENISWGTEVVLQQSIGQLKDTGSTVSLLQSRRDVDEPEDLHVWEDAIASQALLNSDSNALPEKPRLSIIIPTHGKECHLENALEALAINATESSGIEIFVVGDRESHAALEFCASRRIQFLTCDGTRSQRMNFGVRWATSDHILFLHSDTILPSNFLQEVEEALTSPNVAAGAFRLGIESKRTAARLVEKGVHFRSRVLQMPYGDQAIFVRRSAVEAIGGIPDQPIMEDYELVRRLAKKGQITICNSSVKTSARRWHSLGFFKTTLINQLMIVGYHLGISPTKLAKFYRKER